LCQPEAIDELIDLGNPQFLWKVKAPCVSIVVASNFQLEVDKNENKIHASL